MKNIYEVLRQKELELQQLQKDIEALRVAARLLAEDTETEAVISASGGGAAPRVVVASPVAAAGRPAEAPNASRGVRQFP